MNPIISFSIKLIGILAVIFGIHITILSYLNLPLFDNRIAGAYVVNVILGILIYGALYILKEKYLDILGFIFMAGSFLKFTVFFIFFNPIYKSDGQVVLLEATSFLIPYLATLIFESFYLIKLLNKEV